MSRIALLSLWLPLLAACQKLPTQSGTPHRASQSAASAEPRKALVIGVAAYRTLPPLKNPVRDGQSISAVLLKLGFEVKTVLDPTGPELEAAVEDYLKTLGSRDVALIFYSGHAVQLDGSNYLLPADLVLKDAIQLRYRGLPLQELVERVSQRVELGIFILDACRDNPFAGGRNAGARGLMPIHAQAGSFIAYATAPGKTASDNPHGENGLYTKHLLEAMTLPGLELEATFKRAAAGVQRESKGAQIPWMSSSVTRAFRFHPGTVAIAPLPVATAVLPDNLSKTEAPPANSEAMKQQGDVHREAKRYAKAIEAYERAARAGNARALSNLGVMHAQGLGVPANPKKAASYYERAANLGDVLGMTNLGVVLTKGEGVNKSLPQAHFWWRKASQASYPPAMFYLGMSLLETAPNSHAEAFQLFEKAAYLGSLDAMVGLGYCYENGRGVPRDRLAAEKWYASAAARGDREAQQSLKRIRTVLEQ